MRISVNSARLTALFALLATSCALDAHRVDAEASIAHTLSIPDAVVFRESGDSLDAIGDAAATLSLADAARRAVATSPELQIALARVRVAQAESEIAGLLPNPVLDLVLRFPEGGGPVQVDASIAADLLAILERPRRSSAAGNRLEAEASRALSTALDVVATVRELYARVQALEELLPLLSARSASIERARGVAHARLDVGEGTRVEVSTLDSESAELDVELAQRRQELHVARLALARRIGEPSAAATWTLDAWHAPAGVALDEREWITAALRARPEILAIEWEIRALDDEAALVGLEAFDGASASVDAHRDDGEWAFGPGVSTPIPIFGGGDARRDRASARLAEARHRLTETRRGVVEDVRTSLANATGAQSSLDRVVRDLIPAQERRRSELEAAYRAGQVDFTALLLADRALQEARAKRVTLERDLASALNRLERAVGGPATFHAAGGQ